MRNRLAVVAVNAGFRKPGAALAGRFLLLLVGFAIASPAGSSDVENSRPGDWLLAGKPNSETLTLYDCLSGRKLASATLPGGIVGAPTMMPMPAASDIQPAFPAQAPSASTMSRRPSSPQSISPAPAPPALAYAITRQGVLRSFELPSLRARSERSIGAASHGKAFLAAAPPEIALLAVGGEGAEPLVILDARSLAEVHTYRPEKPTAVAALVAIPERASFLVGLARPIEPAEVWELAYSIDAPPVLRGLVHDYRMGEAVPLPGRFTPRVAPVASATSELVRGPMPYEWLRFDTSGRAAVLHLEVRREIGWLPEAREGDGKWLAAAGQGQGVRGWFVGRRGSRAVALFGSASGQLSKQIDLPAPLLDIHSSLDRRLTIVAVGDEQGVALIRIEDGKARATGRRARGNQSSARLSASRDGRCIALLDAADEWLGAEVLR